MAELDDETEVEREEAVAGEGAAITVALSAARRRGGKRDAVDAYLEDQRALIADQRHHLKVQMKHLGLKYFADRMRVGLQIFVALGATAVALFIAGLVWQAATDNGLVIEAFSVPPDLAQRGLTGEVVAGQLEDKLSALQAATESARAAQSYSSDWGHEIKVEIPETGVSISELQRYLRQWLGRETRIGGEVFHGPDGLHLTVRAGGQQGDQVTGPEDGLDGLLEKGAEALYARTQPYRWGVYLTQNGRAGEATAVYQRLASNGPDAERPWALIGLMRQDPDARGQAALLHEAVALNPNLALAWGNLWGADWMLGRSEAELQELRKAIEMTRRPDHGGASARSVQALEISDQFFLDDLLGDYRDGAAQAQRMMQAPDFYSAHKAARFTRALALARDHDPAAAEALLPAGEDDGAIEKEMINWGGIDPPRLAIAQSREDWPAVLDGAKAQEGAWLWINNQHGGAEGAGSIVESTLRPAEAVALAHMGRTAEAQALAATLARDCYGCLRARGVVAALAGRRAEADRWFAEAVRQGPDLPGAHLDWGRAKLARGDVAGAIAELQLAHAKGPHFPDPLEAWGEALMARRDYAGAAARFAEAARYAPEWERNNQLLHQAQAKTGAHG
jgi:tetratricopeptide (TPR) repeat protein